MSKPASGAPAPISNRITVINGQPTTTTRDIAEVFGKQHANVLRIVRQRMEEAGEWGLLNFEDTPYTDPQNGQTYPVIRMTEKGFMFVVQKFTGKKAVATQIAFVDEFERMRKALQEAAPAQPAIDHKPQADPLGMVLGGRYLVCLQPDGSHKIVCVPRNERMLILRDDTVSEIENGACIMNAQKFLQAVRVEPAALRLTDEDLWAHALAVLADLRRQMDGVKARASGKPMKFEL